MDKEEKKISYNSITEFQHFNDYLSISSLYINFDSYKDLIHNNFDNHKDLIHVGRWPVGDALTDPGRLPQSS